MSIEFPNAGPALLVLRDVACFRGGRLLFEGVGFELPPGGALVIKGPNGVGKSSLLRIASGLLRAAAGTVISAAQGRALADERGALDERLPLGDALGFWAVIDGADPAEGMDAMGLSQLAAVPVRMLSTGQRKRATLARVVASGAQLWLLDEPANGLDAEGQERLSAAMAAHRGRGGAVLAATHQPIGLVDAPELALARV